MSQAKRYRLTTNVRWKKEEIEIDPQMIKMVELLGMNFKLTMINMFKKSDE